MKRIKKGDTVQVIVGKDRGKTGKVLLISPKTGSIMVEGLNVFKKHSKPKRQGEKGEIVTVSRPIPASRVLPYFSSFGKGVRVGTRVDAAGNNKVKYCKQCQKTL